MGNACQKNFVKDYYLELGERIIGIKSGLRDGDVQRHWDLQLVIGRLEWSIINL